MAFENLRLERSPDGVATLTLDRPERKNAADLATFDELRRAFDEVAESAEDRVLVLTGAGDAFCSGADLTGMGSTQRSTLDVIRRIHAGVLALSEIPKPTIAKVNGAAAGAGMNLALGCDLIVAARGARFSEIFTRRGLSIDYGGSWLLPRLIGLHRAKELVLLGDFVSAEEAERIGLINRAVPDAELDAFVDAWAERLAAGPPLALSMAKRLLNAGLDATLPQALENEAMAQAVNSGTEDMREAFQAFREKREPRFGGR
ncbi:MAG: enoyl-CoA hydratase [Proteobacteria bacterium]|nr:enoyl-CoA hydratase [Pseudomonadota bacterium]